MVGFKNVRGRIWITGVIATGLAGCASVPPPVNMNLLFHTKKFHAPLNTPLTAQTGDSIFVEGSYIPGEAFTLSREMRMTLPGALHVPFPVSIEAGQLRMVSIHGGWKYFCARYGHATVTFPGFGSMIAQGDCVGVRQSLANDELQWVVDNSHYNHARAIWHKPISAEDQALLRHKWTDRPFSVRQLTRITYDGFYGHQFHFTYEVWSAPANKDSSDFVFDQDPSGKTEIGIHGKVLEITAVNNVQMSYQWIRD